ncbi:hypothetical protein C8R44DRAFT_979533 [Mycena epipterygia]|nr:hypothetical protein C8R44DRAFT_979533 [Mycena epipterygia]
MEDIQSAAGALTLFPRDFLTECRTSLLLEPIQQSTAAPLGSKCYIDLVPPEILSVIFKLVIEYEDRCGAVEACDDLLACAHTCGSWRSILAHSPLLWAELSIFDGRAICGEFITAFGLAKGVSLALDAVIQAALPFSDFCEGFPKLRDEALVTQAVIQGLRHPKGHHRLSISSDGFALLFPELRKPAPALTTLTLEQTVNPFSMPVLDGLGVLDTELFAHTTPNLRHLRLEGFQNVWSSALVQNLTTLHLSRSYGIFVDQPTLWEVLCTLSMSPQLEELHVSGCVLPGHSGTGCPTQSPGMQVLALPHLRRLELAGNAYDMLVLVLHLTIRRDLVVSLTCDAESSPQMVLDICAYVHEKHAGQDESAAFQVEPLDDLAGPELVEFRLSRGNTQMNVFVDSYAGNAHTVGVLDALPLANVKRLDVSGGPVWQDLWGQLLAHLPAVECINAPVEIAPHLSTLLTLSQPYTANRPVPSLSTLTFEYAHNPRSTVDLESNIRRLLSDCTESRKGVHGVQELEVYLRECELEEEEFEEEQTLREYFRQFAGEEG